MLTSSAVKQTAAGRYLLAFVATLTVGVCLATYATPALAAEPTCPNEQLRAESNINPATGQPYSAQLPDCRAYELVSPPETGGIPVLSRDLGTTEVVGGTSVTYGAKWAQITSNGAIYWISRAQPAGTGAVPNGRSVDVFLSKRAAAGWLTRDFTPFPTIGDNELIAGSPDGSAALIMTQASLVPEDQDNPFNSHREGTTAAYDMYRVTEVEPPLLITHGAAPRTVPPNYAQEIVNLDAGLEFNANLSAVAFDSGARLTGTEAVSTEEATAGSTDCYSWADTGTRLAGLTNPDYGAPRNCQLLGMMPDGRPIFEDLAGDSNHGLIVVGNGDGTADIKPVQLSAPSSSVTTFDAISPDGGLAYVTTAYTLGGEERGGEPDVYAVTVPALPQELLSVPGSGGENTVACVSCQVGGGGAATFVGQSADGSHVFFNVAEGSSEASDHPYKGLWSWERDTKAVVRLTEATDVAQLVSSENGQYVIGLTKQLASNPNGTSDVYEFAAGGAPKLLTSGTVADTYRLTGAGSDDFRPPTAAGVSNDGSRVVYDEEPAGEGSLETLQEWTSGETRQLSPIGATSGYYVLGTAGPELEDVFFAAHEPLVAVDQNAGTQDIYDARVDGGFPTPSEPPISSQTPNPSPASISAYTPNLAPVSPSLASLSPDTSTSAISPKPKRVTRAQQLTKMLRQCKKDISKPKRTRCEKAARKKYGPQLKSKKSKT